jgi:hypothetical protein
MAQQWHLPWMLQSIPDGQKATDFQFFQLYNEHGTANNSYELGFSVPSSFE